MYRMASYLNGRCNTDVARLGTRISLQVAHQFVRAITSVAANIAEGYSRGGNADRLRFYTYALGSAREALAWIDAIGDASWEPRDEYREILVQIRRQLLTAIKSMRIALGAPPTGSRKHLPIAHRNRGSQS